MNEKIISTPFTRKDEKLNSMGKTLFDKMLEHKHLIAHTNGITGETETYEVILQKAIRTALKMRSEGIKPKDIVSVSSFISSESLIPYYATYFLGAIPANLYPDLTLAETVHLIKQVRPKMIFVIPEALKLTEDALREAGINAKIVVFEEISKHLNFSEFLLSSSEEDAFVPYENDNLQETASIVFTSGSSGLPKPACLTHLGLLSYIPPYPPRTVVLTFANLHWVSGTIVPIVSIINGANRLLYPNFDPNLMWEAIDKYKVNLVSLMLYSAIELLKNGVPATIDTSSLKGFVIAGAIVTKEQIMHFKECLPNSFLVNIYGQAETNGCALAMNLYEMDLPEKRLDSIGKPLPGFSCKIVDLETGKILGPNQPGELHIKSEFLMSTYYNMDSSHAFDGDGFYKTGDVAYYDEDNYFYAVDRFKEMVKYKVWYLYPSRIEKVLLTHPSVHVGMVFGVPHPKDAEHLMGVVVLKKSFVNKVTEEELVKYVNDRVAEHEKIRAGIKIVDEIPVTVSHKLSKMRMRNLILKGEI